MDNHVIRKTSKRVALTNPTFFQVLGENARDNIDIQPDPKLLHEEFVAYYNILRRLGREIILVPEHPALHSQTFAANVGWSPCDGTRRVVLSNYKLFTRAKEKSIYKHWLEVEGYTLYELPEHITFEGRADLIRADHANFVGIGQRTSPGIKEALLENKEWNFFRNPTIYLELVDENFYHTDTCQVIPPLDDIIYYPKAFSARSQNEISAYYTAYKRQHYKVSDRLAEKLICNSVWIDKTFISNIPLKVTSKSFDLSFQAVPIKNLHDRRCEEIFEQEPEYEPFFDYLSKMGYSNIPGFSSQFYLDGAGLCCLTMFLD